MALGYLGELMSQPCGTGLTFGARPCSLRVACTKWQAIAG